MRIWGNRCLNRGFTINHYFDFRALNRIEDANTAFQLIHLLSHLSLVVLRSVYISHILKGTAFRLNPAIIQQVSGVLAPHRREKSQDWSFRLNALTLNIRPSDTELATVQQFFRASQHFMRCTKEPHIQQMLIIASGRGESRGELALDLFVMVASSMYSDSIDALIEVRLSHTPTHHTYCPSLFQLLSNGVPSLEKCFPKIEVVSTSPVYANSTNPLNDVNWLRTCLPPRPLQTGTDIEFVTKLQNAHSRQPFEVRITQWKIMENPAMYPAYYLMTKVAISMNCKLNRLN